MRRGFGTSFRRIREYSGSCAAFVSLRDPYSKKKCHPVGWHFFLCFHYTIDEPQAHRRGFNQQQNQVRFCKKVFFAIWTTKSRSSGSALDLSEIRHSRSAQPAHPTPDIFRSASVSPPSGPSPFYLIRF